MKKYGGIGSVRQSGIRKWNNNSVKGIGWNSSVGPGARWSKVEIRKWINNRAKGTGWKRECERRWNKDKIGKWKNPREEEIGWNRECEVRWKVEQ